MFDLRLNKFYRIAFGLIFVFLLLQELIEALIWGYQNSMDIDVLTLSTLSLIIIGINNRLTKLTIAIILVYFCWLLYFRHFPAYPEYQAFTWVLNGLGIKSLELQKLIHITTYAGLVFTSFIFSQNKENLKKIHITSTKFHGRINHNS